MENQLNCTLKLTLQDMALRRVAENVFNETDILESIEKWQFSQLGIYEQQECVWRKNLENKIKNKILDLVLPVSLRKQMIGLVRPMTLDILKWKMHHEKILSADPLRREYFDVHVLKQLHRTTLGAIDYEKTAEALICAEMFDIRKRYKLACLYCLVDYISVLWNQLPDRQSYLITNNDTSPIIEMKLEFCWPCILKGEESKLDNIIGGAFCQRAFNETASQGNIAAAKYFFSKLPLQERETYIYRTLYDIQRSSLDICKVLGSFPVETYFEVLRYILSLLSPEQQLHVLNEFHCIFFKIFWEWPWSYLFLDIADVIWTFVHEKSYFRMACYYIVNVRLQCPHFYSASYLQDFFLHSPVKFREIFVSHHSSLFREIFKMEDSETIKVIFRNLEAKNKIKLLFHKTFFDHLHGLILADKPHLVEVCFREANPPKKKLEKLERIYLSFHGRIHRYASLQVGQTKWYKFFHFLNETKASISTKRTSEGEIPTEAKKQHIE